VRLKDWPDGLSVHILALEVSLNGLPNNAIHVSGFGGEDGSNVKGNREAAVSAI
jgi:hypothetical protein